jgi:hypothetical protein
MPEGDREDVRENVSYADKEQKSFSDVERPAAA